MTNKKSKYIGVDVGGTKILIESFSETGKLLSSSKVKTVTRKGEKGFLDQLYELIDLMKNAYILPHGGGYMLPDVKRVQKVLEYKDQRYFACELTQDVNKLKIVRNVKELQFEYRGRDVILKTLQLDLGEIIARLNPVFSLKL